MLLLVLVLAAQSGPSQPTAPAARAIAADTFLLPGAILPERGPDGNTVLVTAPQGLVVVDTGRHAWHSDGILAFARARKQPIAIIVNTHWHLDHSSGNGRIKAEHPGAKVYTTRAVDRALAPEGFLTRNLKFLPVTENGRAMGQIGLKEVKSLTPAERSQRRVRQAMTPLSPEGAIAPRADAATALAQMQRTGRSRLLVVENGRLEGIICLKDLLDQLTLRSELAPMPPQPA